jgi:hypothetical protein
MAHIISESRNTPESQVLAKDSHLEQQQPFYYLEETAEDASSEVLLP